MTDTPGDPSGNNPLYDLLPSVFQQADATEQFPLLALTQILQQVEQELQAGIEALEDVWFVEICTQEYLQLIAALVGVALPPVLRPEHRALVADAIAVRRRKGTAAALPLLLRGASNWYALVLQDGKVPPSAWPLAADGSVPAGLGTRVGLWVWRLPVHAMDAIPMFQLPIAGSGVPVPWSKWYLRYMVNPLGLPEPIWNVASTALPAASPPVTALPVAVTTPLLAADLDRYREDWPGAVAGAPANSVFYGPDRGLLLQWQHTDKTQPWQDLPPGSVRAGTLAPNEFPPPDYAVFLSGPIILSAVISEANSAKVLMDGTEAILPFTVPPQPTMQQLADALQAAFENATPNPIGDVSTADLRATQVVPIVPPSYLNLDQFLALIPGNGIIASIQFLSPHTHDDLKLYTKAGSALALRTVPITDELAARLCDPNLVPQTLVFTDASGQNHLVSLPLASDTQTGWSITDVVAGLQAALTEDAVVLGVAGRVIIIPFPGFDGSSYNSAINTPETGRLCRDLGLERTAVLDPETGSLVWPAGWSKPSGLTASYGRAAVAAIGSGHDQAPVATDSGAMRYAVDATTFEQTLDRWAAADPAIESAVFTLSDRMKFQPVMDPTIPPAPPAIFFASNKVPQTLALQALARRVPLIAPIPAASTGPTPLIIGGISGLAANTGTLQVDGLLIHGGLAIATVPRGSSLNVALTDTTLYAEGMAPALAEQYVDSNPPPHTYPSNTLGFSAERCILGAIDGSNMRGKLSLTDCIVSRLPDPGLPGGDAAAIMATGTGSATLPRLLDVFTTDSAVTANVFQVQMQCSTILGHMTLYGTSSIDAKDALFVGGLTVAGSVSLDHCYVADLQWLPSVPGRGLEGDPPEAATMVRCRRCLGVQAVRLWRCHVRALTLDPERLRTCTCGSDTTEVVSCGNSSSDERGDNPLKAGGGLWQLAGPPIFYPDNCYPNANFARLADSNSDWLLSGASDGGEIGAFNCAQMADRSRQFHDALSSALPLGVEADITYLS